MKFQTLIIGKEQFVVMAERDFQRLQKQAGLKMIRSEFAKVAMRDLSAYRKTGKAAYWSGIKSRLGL